MAKDEKTSSPNFVYILFEASALTLTFVKDNREAFAAVEEQLTPALNYIIQNNLTDLSCYAFQLYATFVASSSQLKENYSILAQSVIQNQSNWAKEMKYLVPGLSIYLVTMISKHPQYVQQYLPFVAQIVNHLLTSAMRMESSALQIAQAVFEKISVDNSALLREVLVGVFTALHFYRNNTKSKVIPSAIMKCIHTFFAVFMVCHSNKTLLDACNSIQKDILFMVLKSEAAAIKYVSEPPRDRKYCLVAYSRLLAEYAPQMPRETVQELICALIEATAPISKSTGFQIASSVNRGVEELLMDGAID